MEKFEVEEIEVEDIWVVSGWMGGMKIDNKDHLSPADLAKTSCNWSWAELGNKALTFYYYW